MRLVLIILVILINSAVYAGGVIQSAKAGGMGTAFTAVSDDASAVSYNPAGLAFTKGNSVSLGLSVLAPSAEFCNNGQCENNIKKDFAIPYVFASAEVIQNKVFVGFGLHSPYGVGGLSWSDNGQLQYKSTESLTSTVVLNPTVAYRFSDKFSAAFGINYLISDMLNEADMDQSAFIHSDAELSLKGDGSGYGYNFGFMYKPSEQINLGFSYRSSIETDYEGNYTIKDINPALAGAIGTDHFSTDFNTSLTMPDVVSVGIAYMPNKKLTLAFDVEYIMWSRFDKQKIDLKTEYTAAGISDQTFNMDWHDIWTFRLGAEYKLSKSLALRGGYSYLDTPVPDNTFSASAPSAKNHNLNLGVGCEIGSFVIDAYYAPAFYEKRKVSNSNVEGSYDMIFHYAGMAVTYKF